MPTKLLAAINAVAYDRPKLQWELYQTLTSFESLCQYRPQLPPVLQGRLDHFNIDQYQADIKRFNIQTVVYDSEHYPHLLKEIPYPPIILFVKGDVSLLQVPALGVVGSRKATSYGSEVTKQLCKELASYFVITSGMALGIDAVAHQTALMNQKPTIAVLGNSIERVYPSRHKKLYQDICEQGVILSEFPPGTESHPHHFPQRNRLISGLSRGVIVIEAGEKSGALITARLAMETNREVFAVPGPIQSPLSVGPHRLIQDGAKLVYQASDVIEELVQFVQGGQMVAKLPFPPAINAIKEKEPEGLSEVEAKVWHYLPKEGIHIDTLQEGLKLDSETLLKTISIMELNQYVQQKPGKIFYKFNPITTH